ncbi:MAG TPA: 50S ribosomal protein L16 [Myxococcaceae bacterium]|nr:50S ribosomal protein L16 [Myxococcaceae bacterium]
MLQPARTKYRKMQKGRMGGVAYRGSTFTEGEWGLIALEPGWVTSRQIEAARIAITRHMKRLGKLRINMFPDKPVTKKPAETRMGTGKGGVEYYVAVIKPGRLMYEMFGTTKEIAVEAFKLAQAKLPIATRIVHRSEMTL